MQTSVTITRAGADRLKRSLALGKAHLHAFRHLGWGRASDALSGTDLRDIVLRIAAKDGGFAIAIDILSMRFHSDKEKEGGALAPDLVDAGRQLLLNADWNSRDPSFDHHLQSIAKVCLAGPDGADAASTLCEKIRQGFADYSFRPYSHEGLLSALFTLQPRVALDAFFPSGSVAQELELDVGDFEGIGHRSKNPLDGVPLAQMLQWCDETPGERYPALAKVVRFYTHNEKEPPEWTPIALEMLDRAPVPAAILNTFVQRFSPSSWSGSRAEIVESRAGLLDRLPATHAVTFADAIAKSKAQLAADVAQTRKWENERDRERDERFE